MRKDILDQAGGLIAFAQYIAEDYFMAKAIADRLARLFKYQYSANGLRYHIFIYSCVSEWSMLIKNYIFIKGINAFKFCN